MIIIVAVCAWVWLHVMGDPTVAGATVAAWGKATGLVTLYYLWHGSIRPRWDCPRCHGTKMVRSWLHPTTFRNCLWCRGRGFWPRLPGLIWPRNRRMLAQAVRRR